MRLHFLTEIGMFFKRQGPVWDAWRDLKDNLERSGIDYVVIGALAVNAHGHRRTTNDVDLCLTEGGWRKFQELFVGTRYHRVAGRPRRVNDPENEVNADILISGQIAGNRRKQQAVTFPDPTEGEIHDQIRTVSLARLIELKLVTWRYKDWGDVVELIRIHDLPEEFADRLNPVVRSAYLQCYDQRLEEDRYDQEQGGF